MGGGVGWWVGLCVCARTQARTDQPAHPYCLAHPPGLRSGLSPVDVAASKTFVPTAAPRLLAARRPAWHPRR